MKLKHLSILFLAITLTSTFSAQAQNDQRGRTTDGRAYRIDKEGMKLVDQIAELEVTIDDLNRKIVALENEIDDKDRKLKRVSEGKIANPEIAERDILAGGPKPALPQVASPEQNCSPLLTPLQAKISQLEKDLSSYKAANEMLNSQVTDLSSQQKFLAQENHYTNERVSQEQNAARDQLARQSSDYERELKTQKSDFGKLQATIESQNSEIYQLQDKLQDKINRELELNQMIDSLNNKVSSLESSVAVYEKEFAAQKKISILNDTARTTMSKSTVADGRSTAGVYAQRELNEKVSTIQKLINERKNLYDRLKDSRSNVLVSMQPLRTSDGESLDEVRKQIITVASEDDAQVVLDKLSEIEKILNDDLKVLKRLSKI